MERRIDKKSPVPAYHQLRIILENDIRKGKYKIGAFFPTETKLAQLYGLSRMTVRQALGELEKEGFILREQGKGTFVIRNKPIRENQCINIGILIYKPALEVQWFFPEFLSGISDGFKEKRVNCVLIPFDEKIEKQKFIPEIVAEKNLTGVIITGEEIDGEGISYLKKNKIPFLLTCLPPENEDVNFICPDAEGGIKKVVEYLIGLGHKRIGFIGTLFSKYRMENIVLHSFIETMKNHSLKVNYEFIKEANYLGENVHLLVKEILNQKIKPTAIVTTDDTLAVKVINALREFQIEVPGDISVTGLNNLYIAKLTRPPLTTLFVPRYRIGKETAEVLFRIINGEKIKVQKLFPLKLILRKSCKKIKEKIPTVKGKE